MRNSRPARIDHSGRDPAGTPRRRRATRRRNAGGALKSWAIGAIVIFAAGSGATVRCSELATLADSADASPRFRALPVSQYPGRTAAQEPSWIRITSMQIQFTAFTLTMKDQEIPIRPQIVTPTVSIEALATRVETTLRFVQAGLSGKPMVATQPLVFVFADEDAGDSAAPILVASFFRGYLHGPLWLLHPETGNPLYFGEYERGMRSGRFLVYDPEGLEGPYFYGEYKNNRKHGIFLVLEAGRPVYAAFYQADIPQGEWLVEWSADQPRLVPVADLPSEKVEVLRRCQRKTNWADSLIQNSEPPIKQLVVQVFRKIDLEIKRVLAASFSVAARQRILTRYEQLSAAQKSFHATVLENATAGTGGAAIYGGIAAQARVEMANASMRNMNEAFRALSVSMEALRAQFRQSVVIVVQKTMVLLREDV